MARKIVSTLTISTEEWLEYRKLGIGGSDAATVLGLNQFSSKFTLYADKLGKIPPIEDNEQMRQGRDLEEYVSERWTEKTGKKCRRTNFMWKHDTYDWMLADIDRDVVGENAGLECKTTSVYNKSDFNGGEVPLYYYVQCMHYMAVMGYDRMYLAVLVLNKGFYDFVIERDEKEIENLAEAERKFWDENVQVRVPPSPDGSDSSQSTINTLYGAESAREGQILLMEYNDTISEFIRLQGQIKALEKDADALKQTIQLAMGDNTSGVSEKYSVTWKPQISHKVDISQLKEFYPTVYSICLKEGSARVFRPSERKEKKK